MVANDPCLPPALPKGTDELFGQMVHQDENEVEKRIELKRSVDLPSPAAMSILQFHTGKKNLVTDNLSFSDCLTMNY